MLNLVKSFTGRPTTLEQYHALGHSLFVLLKIVPIHDTGNSSFYLILKNHFQNEPLI